MGCPRHPQRCLPRAPGTRPTTPNATGFLAAAPILQYPPSLPDLGTARSPSTMRHHQLQDQDEQHGYHQDQVAAGDEERQVHSRLQYRPQMLRIPKGGVKSTSMSIILLVLVQE